MTLFALLFSAVAMMVADALRSAPHESIAQVSAVSRLPGMALSVEYFEPRIRSYADASTLIYPGIEPINYMDFVYAP